MILVINDRLPSLNEYTKACRSNRFMGATMKKNAEKLIGFYITNSELKPINNAFVAHFTMKAQMIFDELSNYMDLDALKEFIEDFGGNNVYIPTLNNFRIFQMRLNLKNDIKTMSIRDIAQKYNVCPDTVKKYLKKQREELS